MNKKQRVLELRDKGLTYRDISHIENMPLGSVKSICARKKEPLLISRCIYCGKSITSIKGRRQKKFCNDKCRMAWWNSHRDLISIKKHYRFTCKNCGRRFTSHTQKNRKYCSHPCYLESRVKHDK